MIFFELPEKPDEGTYSLQTAFPTDIRNTQGGRSPEPLSPGCLRSPNESDDRQKERRHLKEKTQIVVIKDRVGESQDRGRTLQVEDEAP